MQRSQSSSRSDSVSSVRSRLDSSTSGHSRQTSNMSHQSRSSQSALSIPSHRPSCLPESLQDLLQPIVQSLSLLDAAIHARHMSHLQPWTAKVISSIKAALTDLDCMAKESSVLAQFSILARERKLILIELNKLVTCAKIATGDIPSGYDRSTSDELSELEALAKAARGVFAIVKRFMRAANDCGVRPRGVEPAVVSAPAMTESYSSPGSNGENVLPVNRRTSINGRAQDGLKMKAASVGDLRAARRQSSPPPPMPGISGSTIADQSRPKSPATASSTPASATFASSSSEKSSPVSTKSKHERRPFGSVDSDSSNSQTSEYNPPREDATPMPKSAPTLSTTESAADIHESITVAHDALLSIMAAYIGHVHSHEAGSHPSSHATLIEMTRETIDAVREVLTVVEAVESSSTLRDHRPRDFDNLATAKTHLYEVASKLVEDAENLTSGTFADGDAGYVKVKSTLLQTATTTLRAGTDCVRLVKICAPEDESISANVTPRPPDGFGRATTPRAKPPEAGVVFRDKVVGQRGIHTLSGLHRKANSLSHLKLRYQQDGIMVDPPDEEEEGAEDEEDEEVVLDPAREDDMTLRPISRASQTLSAGPAIPPRPVGGHAHAGESLSPVPRPVELLRTLSDDQGGLARSRSSSLSSPAPPQRFGHRSPSRSADLDKFTSDYPTLPHVPRRPPNQRSATYTMGSSLVPAPSLLSPTERSLQSLGESGQPSSMPTTPVTVNQTLSQQSPMLSYLRTDSMSPLGIPRLTIEDDSTPMKPSMLQRPAMPMRSTTAPLPTANTDVRFLVASHDYDPREITFNSEGNMVGASLAVLVEKMTPHDGPPEHTFWETFFFTFRLFTTPNDLLHALIARYSLPPPLQISFDERERSIWLEGKVAPVRFRVYNLLKAWLETHWKADTDDSILDELCAFATGVIAHTLPGMAPRLIAMIRKRLAGPLSATSETRSLERSLSSGGGMMRSLTANSPGLPPTPVISKSLHTLLQKNPSSSSVAITEFDTLELARQLTLLESRLFCRVIPEDLLQTGRKSVPELKALSTMSNQITGWVADNILNEQDAKKRALLLKFYIKLADVGDSPECEATDMFLQKCFLLNNFSTMFALLAGLNSSIVTRLKKTWAVSGDFICSGLSLTFLQALPGKYRLTIERLQGIIEHTKVSVTTFSGMS